MAVEESAPSEPTVSRTRGRRAANVEPKVVEETPIEANPQITTISKRKKAVPTQEKIDIPEKVEEASPVKGLISSTPMAPRRGKKIDFGKAIPEIVKEEASQEISDKQTEVQAEEQNEPVSVAPVSKSRARGKQPVANVSDQKPIVPKVKARGRVKKLVVETPAVVEEVVTMPSTNNRRTRAVGANANQQNEPIKMTEAATSSKPKRGKQPVVADVALVKTDPEEESVEVLETVEDLVTHVEVLSQTYDAIDSKAGTKRKVNDGDLKLVKRARHLSDTQIGDLYAFGDAIAGELGPRERFNNQATRKIDLARVTLPSKVSRAVCGAYHSVVVTHDGKVITYGCNDDHALGRLLVRPVRKNGSTLTDDLSLSISSEDDEDEDDLEEKLAAIPSYVTGIDGKVVKVSAGDMHSAALCSNGKVYIWGNMK